VWENDTVCISAYIAEKEPTDPGFQQPSDT